MFKKIVIFLLVLPGVILAGLRPVPWLTEGAIAFLETYLQKHPDAKVLEFGAGSSTIWFAKRAAFVHSIENNAKWWEALRGICLEQGLENVDIQLSPTPYYALADQFPKEYFDLIVIDGRNRKGCILHSIPILKQGGVLMLDNSERRYYLDGIKLLDGWKEESDVQKKPDSCGFMYRGWTTSWWIKP